MAAGSMGLGARALGQGFRRGLAAVLQPVFGSWAWDAPGWWIALRRHPVTKCTVH